MNFRRVLGVALVACALVGCGVQDDLPGLRLSVTKVVVGGDDDGPWFQVWFRMKNTSDHEIPIPAAAVVCHGNDALGYPAPTQDRHYALRPGALIFVDSSAAGVMRLLAPGDVRDGSERPTCGTPAYVHVISGSVQKKFKIPNSVVKGLNTY